MKTNDFHGELSGSVVTCAVPASESPSIAAVLVESYLERLASERGLELLGDLRERIVAAISCRKRSSEVFLGEVTRPAT